MKHEFMTDVTLRERLKLLWYGRLYISIEYFGKRKGAKPMDVRLAAVNPKQYGPKIEDDAE